jgi:beta-galactosidase/beta-glucuronidase
MATKTVGWSSFAAFAACAAAAASLAAAPPRAPASENLGPYNVAVLEGGVGMQRPLAADASVARAGTPWSLAGWILSTRRQPGTVIVAAVGDTDGLSAWRGIVLRDGELGLELGPRAALQSGVQLEPGRWHHIAATYDGTTARLYLDGRAQDALEAMTIRTVPRIDIAPTPRDPVPGSSSHFGGSLAGFTLEPTALDAGAVRLLAGAAPDFSLINFDQVGVGWPLQEHAWRGLQAPQDPWTLPKSRTAPSAPRSAPMMAAVRGGLSAEAPSVWTLEAWHLRPAPEVAVDGAVLSRPGYREQHWYAAVVPGTVLTTLIARGLYPDPDFGLDNLAIPDSLSRQDYWYRSEFDAPADLRDREATLVFNGINYAAEVWLNGAHVGSIRGAFTRGTFNVTGLLLPGHRNALAVRISPPPHPGIPHEQSIAAGPGENGGMLALDGPTFIATEGWDWIPGIRDRDTGIWQTVELRATGGLRLVDPHIVTRLLLPRVDSAEIAIEATVENRRATSIRATLSARIEAITVRKTLEFPPGTTSVVLDPAEFTQLRLGGPRLWWPNGYGPANLYTLELGIDEGNVRSDSAVLKFGIRQLTYELSLFDHQGLLRRVEVDPTLGTELGQRLVDVRHAAIKRTPQGWAASLTATGEESAAVHPVASESLTPFLVIRVNGVPIAARGGSWGMDDALKRSSRAHLQPYFELHREANLNVIRNWLGQNTEEVFYQLADEYGLLVLNDFWESTQDFQLEAEDPALFLSNARDVILRYRNHPSIALWFGRNEGVPQPVLNEGLADLVASLDGTRYYTGSSNSVNLQISGPYNYRPPEDYFTRLARGFSVEVGTPSLSTLESLRASIPAGERWPLSDSYAYHDWHFGGNGDVASFMQAMAEEYGVPGSLEEFERKAQLMDYVSYRAIFEGFAARLWTDNSGRLLWMTHPAWPSNTWQIYSSDYDTAAAYYAVKKACEPLHAQLDLPDYRLAVVNTTRNDRPGLTLHTRVLSLGNRTLAERADPVDSGANSVTTLPVPLDLPALLDAETLVLVKLSLQDSSGTTLSENVYWQARDEAGYRRLNSLSPQAVAIRAEAHGAGDGRRIDVTLVNRGSAPVLNAKVTMLDAKGARVLPVYYSDNYVALMPGEVRDIEVRCPPDDAQCVQAALRGWNVEPRHVAVKQRP